MKGSVVMCGLLGLTAATGPVLADETPSIVSVIRIIRGPEPLDPFRYPDGMSIDARRGILLVADTGNGRLAIFDDTWRSRGAIEFRPGSERKATAPKKVAIDPEGRLFVLDAYAPEIRILNSRGVHLGYLPSALPADVRESVRPQDIQIDRRGFIHVLYGGGRPGIEVLDPRGRPASRIGFDLAGSGLFANPTAFAVGETGIAVVDAQAERSVMVLSTAGAPEASFGEHGKGDGTVSIPMDVTWGPGETLWVTDTGRHSISVFNRQGLFLGYVGGFGAGPGQFYYPVACRFLADDRIIVLERAGARLQVLEVNPLDVASANAGLE